MRPQIYKISRNTEMPTSDISFQIKINDAVARLAVYIG